MEGVCSRRATCRTDLPILACFQLRKSQACESHSSSDAAEPPTPGLVDDGDRCEGSGVSAVEEMVEYVLGHPLVLSADALDSDQSAARTRSDTVEFLVNAIDASEPGAWDKAHWDIRKMSTARLSSLPSPSAPECSAIGPAQPQGKQFPLQQPFPRLVNGNVEQAVNIGRPLNTRIQGDHP